MKTIRDSQRFNRSISWPEIMVWILGILTIIGIFFCPRINAQVNEYTQQDTIWLKSGEVITCEVAEFTASAKNISARIVDTNGDTSVHLYPRKEIERINSAKGYGVKIRSAIPPSPKRIKGWVSLRIGTSYSIGIAATAVFKNTLGLSVNYKYCQVKAQNTPDNYWSLGGYPTDRLGILSFLFVKEFYFKMNRIPRLGLEAGPSLTTFSEAHFSKRSSFALFGPNYETNYRRYPNVMGATIRFKTEFLFTPVFGLEVAIIGNINQYVNFFGAEICINLGHVRDDKKTRK
jgi:hypothetical protein